MTNIDEKQFEGLSEKEKEIALKILQEYSNTGKSETYNSLLYEDYKEIPVDIITFISDDRYLGNAWKDANGKLKLYPFWQDKLKELFPDNLTTSVNNLIESGARGLGKSEVAVTVMLYLMYRLMCLKNPHQFLHLKPTEKVCFAFMNITIKAVEDIANDKFQNTVKLSPWFLERGTITGVTNKVWNPPDWIEIILGSQSSHVIGRPIYACLDGDTIILTSTGEHKIKDLENKSFRVHNMSEKGSIILSDECTVKITGYYQDEYKIVLEDDTIITCTPTHKFMLKDGSYKEA